MIKARRWSIQRKVYRTAEEKMFVSRYAEFEWDSGI